MQSDWLRTVENETTPLVQLIPHFRCQLFSKYLLEVVKKQFTVQRRALLLHFPLFFWHSASLCATTLKKWSMRQQYPFSWLIASIWTLALHFLFITPLHSLPLSRLSILSLCAIQLLSRGLFTKRFISRGRVVCPTFPSFLLCIHSVLPFYLSLYHTLLPLSLLSSPPRPSVPVPLSVH